MQNLSKNDILHAYLSYYLFYLFLTVPISRLLSTTYNQKTGTSLHNIYYGTTDKKVLICDTGGQSSTRTGGRTRTGVCPAGGRERANAGALRMRSGIALGSRREKYD